MMTNLRPCTAASSFSTPKNTKIIIESTLNSWMMNNYDDHDNTGLDANESMLQDGSKNRAIN